MEHRTWNIQTLKKLLHAFYLFYIRFFIPAFLVALIITLSQLIITGNFSTQLAGYSYFFFAIGFQFVLYDLNQPGQYYFYYNLGMDKRLLWLSSIILNFLIGAILFIV